MRCVRVARVVARSFAFAFAFAPGNIKSDALCAEHCGFMATARATIIWINCQRPTTVVIINMCVVCVSCVLTTAQTHRHRHTLRTCVCSQTYDDSKLIKSLKSNIMTSARHTSYYDDDDADADLFISRPVHFAEAAAIHARAAVDNDDDRRHICAGTMDAISQCFPLFVSCRLARQPKNRGLTFRDR